MISNDSKSNDQIELLVVDDDPSIRALLRDIFQENGFGVREANDVASAISLLETRRIGLVTLDLRLGNEDGVAATRLLKRVRDVPIIMITARADDIDRIIGLEVGADDYIVKPFNVREVLARVRAVLRRSTPAPARADADQGIAFGDYRLISERMEVKHAVTGALVALTGAEFNLLKVLVERRGRVLGRDTLLELLKQGGGEPDSFDRAVDTLVARVRRKIEPDLANPTYIRTVRGVGYVFTGGHP